MTHKKNDEMTKDDPQQMTVRVTSIQLIHLRWR